MLRLAAAMAALVAASALAAPPAATDLQTEFLTEPVALDVRSPRFSWKIDCGPAWSKCKRGTSPASYRVVVRSTIAGKPADTVWDSGVVSSNTTSSVAYAGKALVDNSLYAWTVQWVDEATGEAAPESAAATFGMGPFNEAGFGGAQWVRGTDPSDSAFRAPALSAPSGGYSRVVAHVIAPGGFSLFVDGEEVTPSLGVMEWLQFDKTMLYHSVDITATAGKPGPHSLVVMAGSGFWGHFFGQQRALKAVVWAEDDGGKGGYVASTGPGWESAAGAFVSDDPFGGVVMDWSRWDPSGSGDGWKPVARVSKSPSPDDVAARAMPAVEVTGTGRPNASVRLGPNHYRFDFRINTVGVVRVTVPPGTPAGATVTLKHGEVLLPNGSVSFPWNETLQTDTHVVSPAVGTITPRFTWHGFQFVEVWGAGGFEVTADLGLEALTTQTAVASAGQVAFAGGSGREGATLNSIQDITLRGQRNNLAAYMPTDCPTREKHGWLGDALSTAEEAMYNLDMTAVYRRFIKTMIDSSHPSGDLPGAVPNARFLSDAPVTKPHLTDISWTGAFPQIARWLMLYAGDTRTASEAWPALNRYMAALNASATNSSGGAVPEDYTWGDWCAVEARAIATPNTGPQLSAFNYVLNADAMAQMAAVLGRADDQARYEAIAAAERPRLYRDFFNASSGLFGKTSLEAQSCTAAPLVLGGVVPGGNDSALADRLAEHIRTADASHLTYGSVGAKHVLPVLTKTGHHDLAMAVATQRSFPSFGHWVEQGATTPWEDWSGVADPTHPPPPTHDHIFLAGGVGEWMYRSVAGIAPAANGYNAVRCAPAIVPGSGPDAASANVSTVRGPAAVAWSRSGSGLALSCTVPVGATGEVVVPTSSPGSATIQEGGTTVWASGGFRPGADGITGATRTPTGVAFAVKSGHYAFVLA